MNQPDNATVTQTYVDGSAPRLNVVGKLPPEIDRSTGSHSYGMSYARNSDSG